jgi:hypothetical protein
MTIGTGEAVVPLTSAVRAGRACTNSVPQGCPHGKERQGRSVERATRAHSTVVHGYVMAHTAEAMPPRLPSHHRLALALSSRSVAQPLADRSVQGLIPRCRWTTPRAAGLPGRVPTPHRLGNALAQPLRLASPRCPTGGPHMLVPMACSRLCLALPWHRRRRCGAGALAPPVPTIARGLPAPPRTALPTPVEDRPYTPGRARF